jgi:hypothetical protein
MTVSRRTALSRLSLGALSAMVAPGIARADQPHMQAALAALRTAAGELELAGRDKGGHRERALRLVRQAIAQVERGISFDRRH